MEDNMFRHNYNSWTDTETDTNRKLEIISTCCFDPDESDECMQTYCGIY